MNKTAKYYCKYFAVLTGIVAFLEFLAVCMAYCFGAKCVDSQAYETAFTVYKVVFMVGCMLLVFCGIILCIALAFFGRRLATLKLLTGLIVVFVELAAFGYLIRPVQFYCLKGFVNHVPGKIDVEAVQDWLDNAEMKQTADGFEFYGYTAPSKEVASLHPSCIWTYNHDNRRAIKVSYGNRATATHFGIVIVGKEVNPAESAGISMPGRRIKDVNEHCYLWTGIEANPPFVARILGFE